MKRRTKRKIKRFFHKNSVVLFIVPLIVSIFCLGIAYSQFKQQFDIDGNANIVGSSEPGAICKVGLTFEELQTWDTSTLSFKVTFTNNSDEDMHSFVIKFKKNGKFSFSYGTGIKSSQDDDYFYLEFESWVYAAQLGNEPDGSQRLSFHPGESITIEFGFSITEPMTVDDIMKLGTITNCGQYDKSEYTEIKNGNAVMKLSPVEVQISANIQFEKAEVYSNQLSYLVTITNNHAFDITNWRVNAYYGSKYKYDSAWPAYFNIIDDKTSGYNVDFNSLNTLIAAGESIEFHITLIDPNPVYEYDENGTPSLVIDENYKPDVIAGGIKEGTTATSVEESNSEG